MKAMSLFLLVAVSTSTSFGADLKTSHSTSKIVKVTVGNFLPPKANLVIDSENDNCVVTSEFAKENGYDVLALASLISQDLVNIECGKNEGKITANVLRIFFK